MNSFQPFDSQMLKACDSLLLTTNRSSQSLITKAIHRPLRGEMTYRHHFSSSRNSEYFGVTWMNRKKVLMTLSFCQEKSINYHT
jgi:hypothetical protein